MDIFNKKLIFKKVITIVVRTLHKYVNASNNATIDNKDKLKELI